ncbi:DNA-binding transcriptional regulator, FadR family [Pedobacter steynii]|uniref:DNA-binding transcriptional regulator, FadR family n=1 Tax=Pedobacter steynii TaxID=430522 RepID=A0A1G9J5U5_9SPHI|nr:FadR/GntR family transcriptional regulator [Pedobacter steynii]NQX38144.1 FadR family transcriptional regulator [Pedobacter steynii]SDL32605.1 DNA-binding transcriptional regulator, FadR family [Pedobacter steynii]
MKTTIKLSDKVIIGIQKDIASGKLKKGEKIPAEPELMALYDVGRSSIREAIKTLAISGILKVQQGSGTFVASKIKDETLSQRLKRADFEEINSVRSLLEKEIVRLACQHRCDQDILMMQEHLQQRRKAIEGNQQKKCAEADIAFHISIAKSSGNHVLSDLYENFSTVMRNFFSLRDAEDIKNFANSQHLHESLAAAIVQKNPQLAEQLVLTILDNNY